MQTTASSAPRNPAPTGRDALYFPPNAQPICDLAVLKVSPNARLVLLVFWRRSDPFADTVDVAVVRRECGLDRLSFDQAVLELRRAGLVMNAEEFRKATRGQKYPMALVL